MTIDEFSNSFDTLLNSYALTPNFGEETSKQTITLDEYEKSVLLTKAQEEIVLSLYNGKNPYGEAFEGTEELRRYLSNLITEKYLKPITNTSGTPLGLESKSKFFTLPEDLWFITLESVVVDNGKCNDNTIIKVYPVKQDEYQVIRDNPFRGANDRRALRLDLSEGNVEIICKYLVSVYYIRYIKKVPPIVLIDLPDGLSVEGEAEAKDCILHKALHQRILDRAVQLALQSRGYGINKSNNS
jgi:hypothetical protein|nr:MAG TPA: hypothetical protein [Crassvirales sp.]